MTYTIAFTEADPERKATQAIEATKSYLGDRFAGIIEMFTQAITDGEIATRKQVRLGMSFVGVRGFPVEALIEKYWPTLPA